MSDNINFSGSIERALKGDIDPINIAGLNPSRADHRANRADRARRQTQIDFEQTSASLKKTHGSTDPATKQVSKLKNKTTFAAFSPFHPPGPAARTTTLLHEVGIKDKDKDKREARLAATNRRHAETALTEDNLLKRPGGEVRRLSDHRMRQAILR